MRKSRSEAAETRRRIISTAAKMFLDKGLGAVGMRDLMAGADLTPGGFYRHFQTKDQLIAEANSAAFERLLAMFEIEIVGKPAARALERIVAVYLGQSQAAKTQDSPYLCPLARLGAELSHSDPQVRAAASKGHQRLVQLIATHLTHMPKRDALTSASGMVSTMVGAVTLAGIEPDAAAGAAILSSAQALIEKQILAETSAWKRKRTVRRPKPQPRA